MTRDHLQPAPADTAQAVQAAANVLQLPKSTVALLTILVPLLIAVAQSAANVYSPPPSADVVGSITALSTKIDSLEQQTRDKYERSDRLLRAILTYQLELDRSLRNDPEAPPRPVELDEAAARIRELMRQ